MSNHNHISEKQPYGTNFKKLSPWDRLAAILIIGYLLVTGLTYFSAPITSTFIPFLSAMVIAVNFIRSIIKEPHSEN